MVTALGGPADLLERYENYLEIAPIERTVAAPGDGFVAGIETRDIGLAVVELGGGRTDPAQKIDHAVGVTRLLPVGTAVQAGDALALVHARSSEAADRAAGDGNGSL